MSKYLIWDKQSDIYTLGADKDTGKMQWTAAEYISAKAPWAANPDAHVIVGGNSINGLCFMAYDTVVEQYISNGMAVPEDATPQEVVLLMEQFEKNQAAQAASAISPEERMAAALEYQNLLAM